MAVGYWVGRVIRSAVDYVNVILEALDGAVRATLVP
jgi:hypothetical protein